MWQETHTHTGFTLSVSLGFIILEWLGCILAGYKRDCWSYICVHTRKSNQNVWSVYSPHRPVWVIIYILNKELPLTSRRKTGRPAVSWLCENGSWEPSQNIINKHSMCATNQWWHLVAFTCGRWCSSYKYRRRRFSCFITQMCWMMVSVNDRANSQRNNSLISQVGMTNFSQCFYEKKPTLQD